MPQPPERRQASTDAKKILQDIRSEMRQLNVAAWTGLGACGVAMVLFLGVLALPAMLACLVGGLVARVLFVRIG